ncbi:MAG TPA: hypothetical protein VIX86_22990 [Streptosporangiaceae bacterium]
MSVPVRVATLLVAFALVVAGAVFVVIHYLVSGPATVDYTSVASNGQVNVVMQEDPQNNSVSTPNWVSYYVQDPQTKAWVHTTLFKVPAHTRVNMTILGYDGCTPLRNNFWSQIQGTIGGTVTVQQFGQKLNSQGVAVASSPTRAYGPPVTTSVINSWSSCNVAHTFAIPSMNVYVPVASPNANNSLNNLCAVSPCTSGPHAVETFSFMTRASGIYRWQCLIPCGGGFIDGNGGPMQTIGYMTGNMVVS